ncbi:MAG: hypothetical protein LBL93_01095 [Ruminococcus sp.]|jgi:hypothetical protein|nr:hypothetical protein [Ruminococcus sp.]
MYSEIKLDKTMYNLTGKSFMNVLTELDPDDEYIGTSLENTDAFTRQLKRFNIITSGQDCSTVEKFFETSESAVLFPEFVRRAVIDGMKMSKFSEIIAAYTKVNDIIQSGVEVDDSTPYNGIVAQTAELPATVIKASGNMITLSKYGRQIKTSYEFIRRQRLDVFTILLKDVGKKFAGTLFSQAVSVAKTGVTVTETETSEISYADLVRLYGEFADYDMTTLVVSPATMAKIMVLDEIKDMKLTDDGKVFLPFGVELVKFNGIGDNLLMGLDKNFALEMFIFGDIVFETDKLINQQMDIIAFTVNCAFKRLSLNSVKTLNVIED